MKPISACLLYFYFLVVLSSCTTTRYPSGDRYPFPRTEEEKRERDDDKREGNGRTYPFSSLGIPKGHLPPPGECKIWIPGKEPGQQGPPQSCASALRNAPLGAWVITHEGSRYKVNIFSRGKRNVIEEVRYYLSK